MKDTETTREPLDPAKDAADVDEMFTFNSPQSGEQLDACLRIERVCHQAALEITRSVPEGRERNIAVNNVLSAVLMSRHGIAKRQIIVQAVAP
jgi:hypothetical protein